MLLPYASMKVKMKPETGYLLLGLTIPSMANWLKGDIEEVDLIWIVLE